VVGNARSLVLPRCTFRTSPLTSPPGSPVGFEATGRSLRLRPLLIEASVEAGRFTGRAIRSDVDLDRQITGRAKLEQTNGRVLPVRDVDFYPCTAITGLSSPRPLERHPRPGSDWFGRDGFTELLRLYNKRSGGSYCW